MKLTVFFSCVIALASGKALQRGSPEQVFTVPGEDAVLPCGPVSTSGITVVEWSRVDGPSPLILLVVRNGKELLKEKAREYGGRTAIVGDVSLKLLGIRRSDSGTYRCVVRGESAGEEEVFVSLIVAQVSEVNPAVRRTSANELFVLCESSGWSPEPQVSLLDSGRTVLAAQLESSVQPDRLYSVRASVNVAATEAAQTGNRTFICRVELPGLVKESVISVTDEFVASSADLGCHFVIVFAVLLGCVVFAVVVFVVPLQMITKLRFSVRRLGGFIIRLIEQQADEQRGGGQRYTEYGDINKMETRGASEQVANVNNLQSTGTEASNQLAEKHHSDMLKYKEDIISVGEELSVHPALIAAIISKQSLAGTHLKANGYGKSDNNCFGLMQINKNYHAVKGDPFGRVNIDQGVTYLIQLFKKLREKKTGWTTEMLLEGALVCYIAGDEKVIPLRYEELDSVTPTKDFASDVIARAKWFALNGF